MEHEALSALCCDLGLVSTLSCFVVRSLLVVRAHWTLKLLAGLAIGKMHTEFDSIFVQIF